MDIHEHVIVHVQVFFVEDKSLARWCVVLKKEARGRQINSTETEYELGQESIGNRLTFPEMEARERRRDVQQSGR